MPSEAPSSKPCCLISELLEESGLDRERVRALKRQTLQGLMLFCQWQLDRMERPRASSPRRPRRVRVD
jgi:hypothetical protein